MGISEQEILQLLLDKGVSPKYINSLKKRPVFHINSRFYKEYRYTQENNVSAETLIKIPVSKIVSAPRIYGGSLRSWWKNIFDDKVHVPDQNRWNNIYKIFEQETLKEFHHSLSNFAPPLEGVAYYENLDVYEVYGGHHRTIWALLTNTPYLRVRANNFCIYREDKDTYTERMSFLAEKKTLKKEIRSKEKSLKELIELLGLAHIGDYAEFKGTVLCWFEKKRFKYLCKYGILDDARSYLHHLEYAKKRLEKLHELHKKYKIFPMPIRLKVVYFKNLFTADEELKDLLQLYKKGWNPKF